MHVRLTHQGVTKLRKRRDHPRNQQVVLFELYLPQLRPYNYLFRRFAICLHRLSISEIRTEFQMFSGLIFLFKIMLQLL